MDKNPERLIADIDKSNAIILILDWLLNTAHGRINISKAGSIVSSFVEKLSATEHYKEIAALNDPEKLDVFCLASYMGTLTPDVPPEVLMMEADEHRVWFQEKLKAPFKR